MQGTGPPPPGLQIGRRGPCAAADAGAAVLGTAPGGGAGEAAGAAACCEGAPGDAAEGQGWTLIAEPLPPGSRLDTSFSGTAVELLGSVKSSQYTVPGSIRSTITGLKPMVCTAFILRPARSRSVKSPREILRPPTAGGIASASSMPARSSLCSTRISDASLLKASRYTQNRRMAGASAARCLGAKFFALRSAAA